MNDIENRFFEQYKKLDNLCKDLLNSKQGVSTLSLIHISMEFTNFKIEGRGLGSALILEFLLYYMTKPEYQINVREKIYLDNMLDLF